MTRVNLFRNNILANNDANLRGLRVYIRSRDGGGDGDGAVVVVDGRRATNIPRGIIKRRIIQAKKKLNK